MKIFVTGATGLIGSHFLKSCLDSSVSILALRRSQQSLPKISLSSEPVWLTKQLDEVTQNDLSGCDVLVHLAAHSVLYPFDTLENCLRWNLTAMLSLFENARQAGIKRFIVAGSCFEYGKSGERYSEIPTNAPLEPVNSYAVSKAAASIALSQWALQHQLSLEILRIFHVYGEGEAPTRFWPLLRKAALYGDDFPMTLGEQVRDFQDVESVAYTFLQRALLNKPLPSPQIFNLSSSRHLSLFEFATYYWTFFNASGSLIPGAVDYRPNETMRFLPGDTLLPLYDIPKA